MSASAERTSAAALVPVDDGEFLLKPENPLEAAHLAEHRKARALLDQQEHRIGSISSADTDPLGGVSELYLFEDVGLHVLLQTWAL